MLKIAPCWPLTGSVYTAITKAVQVMSIFDLKSGMSGSASCDINSSWQSIYDLFFCWQKKRTRRHKNSWNAATQLWYRCLASLGLKRTSSVLSMARLQHEFGSILSTLAGEKVPSWAGSMPARFIEASWASTFYQSELGQHGMVQLSTTLARFGHVYTTTANYTEPCWYHAGTVSSGSVNAVLVTCNIITSPICKYKSMLV